MLMNKTQRNHSNDLNHQKAKQGKGTAVARDQDEHVDSANSNNESSLNELVLEPRSPNFQAGMDCKKGGEEGNRNGQPNISDNKHN